MSQAYKDLQERTAADYTRFLQNLLPRGLAWTKAPDATLTKTLQTTAEEAARLDALIRFLPVETNPLTTYGALSDWERVLGLPDACLPAGNSFQERKEAVLAKLRDQGRQDLAYWYELAKTLGYEITIEEHTPFLCNHHQCGDPRGGWTPESGMTVERWEQDVAYPISRLNPPESRYWLNIIVHGDRVIYFRCGGASLCPDYLMTWRSAENLECLMHRDKEAHILVTFEYRSGGFYGI